MNTKDFDHAKAKLQRILTEELQFCFEELPKMSKEQIPEVLNTALKIYVDHPEMKDVAKDPNFQRGASYFLVSLGLLAQDVNPPPFGEYMGEPQGIPPISITEIPQDPKTYLVELTAFETGFIMGALEDKGAYSDPYLKPLFDKLLPKIEAMRLDADVKFVKPTKTTVRLQDKNGVEVIRERYTYETDDYIEQWNAKVERHKKGEDIPAI